LASREPTPAQVIPGQPERQPDHDGLDEDQQHDQEPPQCGDEQFGDHEPGAWHGQGEHDLGGALAVLAAEHVGDDEREQ